jgi:cation diffusion facilitator family transporter
LIGGRGFESADDWAAMFAATVIVFNAVRILRPAIREIMDAAPPAEFEDAIRQIAQRVDGVIALEKCFIRKMGFSYYVDMHVTVDGALPVRLGHDIARQVKDTIRTSYPNVAEVLVHIEPSDLLEE